MVGSSHEQQTRQEIEENQPNPAWHPVSPGTLEIPIDDYDCDDNRYDVHDEREQQVLGDQRNRQRRRRKNLRHSSTKRPLTVELGQTLPR